MTGIWVAADVITAARANEKTIFQGTGAAISGLATTYPGQLAFCTSTGSGFNINMSYVRNVANTAWISATGEAVSTLIMASNSTIGDYTAPTSVMTSSPDLSFTDDYTTYASNAAADAVWAPAESTINRVNITNDNLPMYINGYDSPVNSSVVRDIGNITNNNFELRFKVTFSGISGSYDATAAFGIFSGDKTVSNGTAQDGIALTVGVTSTMYAQGSDGDANFHTTGTAMTTSISATTYYVKIARTSLTSATVTLYSNSGYTTVVETKTLVIASTLTDLRYVGVKNYRITTNPNFSRNYTATLDDFTFYSPVNTTLWDDNTATKHTSSSMTNPSILLDMSSSVNASALAIYPDMTLTTETEIKIQGSADAVTFTDLRKITVSNLTDSAWNYIRFNVGLYRYIRIYGTGTSKILSIYEVKALKYTDALLLLGHGHLAISNSDTSIPLTGE